MLKEFQFTRGLKTRLLYVENKHGQIDGASARIGWVRFSKTGRTIYYRGRELAKARGLSGNFIDVATGEEYWVSGVKRRGSNTHEDESGVSALIDADAMDEYRRQRPA